MRCSILSSARWVPKLYDVWHLRSSGSLSDLSYECSQELDLLPSKSQQRFRDNDMIKFDVNTYSTSPAVTLCDVNLSSNLWPYFTFIERRKLSPDAHALSHKNISGGRIRKLVPWKSHFPSNGCILRSSSKSIFFLPKSGKWVYCMVLSMPHGLICLINFLRDDYRVIS